VKSQVNTHLKHISSVAGIPSNGYAKSITIHKGEEIDKLKGYCTKMSDRITFSNVQRNCLDGFLPKISKTNQEGLARLQASSTFKSKRHTCISEELATSERKSPQPVLVEEKTQAKRERFYTCSEIPRKMSCLNENQCANLNMALSAWTETKGSVTFNINQNFYFSPKISPRPELIQSDCKKPSFEINVKQMMDSKKGVHIKVPKNLLGQPDIKIPCEDSESCDLRKTGYFVASGQNQGIEPQKTKSWAEVNPKSKHKKFNFLKRMADSIKKNNLIPESIDKMSNFNIRNTRNEDETGNQCEISFGLKESE
jgi:hypothetical protein